MCKPIPLRYGRYYHIYNRGNNRENIFVEEQNYGYFLKLYAKYIPPVADTYAYNLLPNHFHFETRIKTLAEQEEWHYQQLAKTPYATPTTFQPKKPSKQFGNLFNAYAKAFNKKYHRSGSLFERPFCRVEITTITYFRRLLVYIHRNAERHGIVPDFRDWPHSSYHTHLSNKPTRLRRHEALGWFDDYHDFEVSHQQRIEWHLISPLAPEDFD